MVVTLRTARDYRLPWSVMVGTRESGWTDKDRILALALTMHEDGLHSCGHPKSIAFSPWSDGYFEVRSQVCQACAAGEMYARTHKDHKGAPGEVFGVANTLRDDETVNLWMPSLEQGDSDASGR